jgi:outer membrane murein-binding lipoprotein Lpp
MSATVEELAARVARLEEDMSRIRDLRLDVGLQAQAYGLSLVHTDTQAIRADMAEVKQMLGEVLSRLSGKDP